MARIAVVGDGPAGLSAALFLAKGDHETVVFGDDGSLMAYAELHNYLGAPGVSGPRFQETARQQVADVGGELRGGILVTGLQPDGDGVAVETDGEDSERFDYVVIAGGKESQGLAEDAGAQVRDKAVVVDGDARTTVDRIYAAGHLVRPERSQAIISAGMGAAAALDILSRESGRDVHDWDTPE